MKDFVFIGKMDRRIDIVKKIPTKGSTGADYLTSVNIASVWASKKPLKSDESVDDKVVMINSDQFVIRYHPDIVKEKIQHLYVVDNNVELNVYGVEKVGRKQFLKLNCDRRE
ncbi:phage head completion protein [Aquimarina sp. 2201CG14-23]|uniref:phage head completion protein n=1 Tax=Aquimarina mycalae TaxID=3040073 RepID=UPI0024782970|nr:head-tail adaptor protein [Aquimarina sp. 2201CG14-23]MDH7444674.1 head-tail adaptor protein [Aquimarina sp. 2201CG14-23]